MPIPFAIWAGVAAVGAVTGGGYAFGQEVGERTGKVVPLIAGSLLAYMAYQAAKK